MNIAIFIKNTTLHNSYGGLETQNLSLAKGFIKKGHKVTIFSPKQNLTFDHKIEDEINYVFVPAVYRLGFALQKLDPYLNKIFKKFEFSKDMFSDKKSENWIQKSQEYFEKYHQKKPFDIVLCQSAIGIGILQKKDAYNVKVISISHGTIMSEYKTKLLEIDSYKSFLSPKYTFKFTRNTLFVLKNYFTRQRQFIHGSDKIIAVSNDVKKNILDETFTTEDKIVVIHNGVDITKFPERKSSKPSFPVKFIFFGRVVKQKGVFLLVECINALIKNNIVNENDFKLYIGGDGDDLQLLKAQVSKYGLNSCILFLGKIPHDQVVKYLYESDVFILPTLRVEGFPMVLPEAMLSSIPVIASDIGGISDAVINLQTGMLVKPGDGNSLQNCIVEMISNFDLRQKMGNNARIKAQSEFTLDVMINKYLQVIMELTK